MTQLSLLRTLTAAATIGLLAASPSALGARNSLGSHTVVGKHGANVRADKDGDPTGVYKGHLKKGDHFRVTKHDGSFCFGKAAGHVNKTGWVLCGALSK